MRNFWLFLVSLLTVAATRGATQAAVSPSVLVVGGAMSAGPHFIASTRAVMQRHYAGCQKIVLVLHADLPRDRSRREVQLKAAFGEIGFAHVESLHHADLAGQRMLLEQADGIFVSGGETFVLLAELYRTGQLDLIRSRVAAGVPYGGSSAGANVAGQLIGTTNDFPVAEIPSRRALAIFPAVINPHHPAPSAPGDFDYRAERINNYLGFNPTEIVLGLGNGAMARLHDGRVTLEAGLGWVYQAKGRRSLVPGDLIPELLPEK